MRNLTTMDVECIVCCKVSSNMFTIESETGKSLNMEQLLLRFGGLHVSSGLICHTDRKKLLCLSRLADRFYEQCQLALAKRLKDFQAADKINALSITEQDKVKLEVLSADDTVRYRIPEHRSSTDFALLPETLQHVSVCRDISEMKTERDLDAEEVIPQNEIKQLLESEIKSSADKHAIDKVPGCVRSSNKAGRPRKQRSLTKLGVNSAALLNIRLRETGKQGTSRHRRKSNDVNVDELVSKSRSSKRISSNTVDSKIISTSSSDESTDCDYKNSTVQSSANIQELYDSACEEKCSERINFDANNIHEKEKVKRKKKRRHNSETNICYLCGAQFQSTSGFHSHMKSHNSDGGFQHKCTLCYKQYSRPSYLQAHMHAAHSTASPGTERKDSTANASDIQYFICHECGKRLTSRTKLKYHMESHSVGGVNKPHPCTLCSRRFRQANALKIHMRRHTGELPFKCSLCENQFTDSYSLRRHEQYNHSPDAPIPCTECNRHFATAADLEAHVVTHNRAKVYKCPVCDRGFRNRSNLSKHKKIHTGVKAHACSLCEARFTIMTHLKRHIAMVHNSVKPFSCSLCAATFSSGQSLKRHGWLHNPNWTKRGRGSSAKSATVPWDASTNDAINLNLIEPNLI